MSLTDLNPRKKAEERPVRCFQSDLDTLRELIKKLNDQIDPEEGTFLEEDVFAYLIGHLEKTVKKKVNRQQSKKPLKGKKPGESSPGLTGTPTAQIDLGNLVPEPPGKK